MSNHVLLNLLNELRKVIQYKVFKHLSRFLNELNEFKLYRDINVKLYLSYDTKINLK